MGRIVHSLNQELSFVPFFLPRRRSLIPTSTRGQVSDEITRLRVARHRFVSRPTATPNRRVDETSP